MATYTVLTGTAGAPVDYAALGLRVNGDLFSINGGYLKVDCDTRYGLNGAAAAAIGSITMSAALGGTILFDSTKVRLIPFTGGSGVVPANDTVISQGSASGKMIAVYAAINSAPTAVGAAMPATGFIKIRAWNSVSYAASALTGITATGNVDQAGWLEIVGLDAGTATVNRLNQFLVTGGFYLFQNATTSGVNTTTYQIPTNGSAVNYFAGVEVETAVAGVYEFYPCAGSIAALVTNIATDNERGKVCWINATTGMVRFGHDGTNATGGFVPPAGRKIRIPNIFFTCCVAAATANIIPNATLATRYEFATTGGGVVSIDKAMCNWYCNFAQPYSIQLTNTYTFEAIILTECATAITWDMVGIGLTAANSQQALTMGLNFAGGTLSNCKWVRSAQAATGNYVAAWNDCDGFTSVNCRNFSLVKAANATAGSVSLTRVSNSSFTSQLLGGGRVIFITCTNVTFTNTSYYDHPALTTGTAIPMYAFSVETGCINITIDGLDFGGLVNVQPYNGLVAVASAGCANTKIRNIGSSTTPLDLGGAQVDATWTQATTTASVTKAGHGLKVGDIIYVQACSGIASIPIGSKTVVAITSTSVFTFACTTGALTGTLTYYPTMSAHAVVLGTGAAANGVYIQRVYTAHTRTGFISGDNSSKNIVSENSWGGAQVADVYPILNLAVKQCMNSPAFTAQTSVYGTHFGDYLTAYPTPNMVTVSWTRVTTVATITSVGHNLRTTSYLPINVTTTSDVLAIVKGVKTITVMTADTFTIPCLNAGATSGTLTFEVANGRMAIAMNEPTSNTISQAVVSNGAAFTSAGGLYMPVIGHQADFTWSYSPLGYIGFPIQVPVMVGGGAIANYNITYSMDGGSTYKNLYYSRLEGGGASASTNVTMTSTTGVNAGDYVFGTNIGWNAKVVSITNATTIVVDTPNIGTVSGTLIFTQLPNETPSASLGFSLKVRIVTAITNTTAINALTFYTKSDAASMAYQYALDSNTVTFTGLPTGCDAVVLAAGTNTILASQDAGAGTSYAFTYSGAQTIDIGFIKAGYVPYYIRNLALTTADSSIPVSLTIDRNYA